MPIDVSFMELPKQQPQIPKGIGYRYDPVDYDCDEWKLTYFYTFEDEHHVRIVFKDIHDGTHVRIIWKDKTMKDF